MSSVVAPRTLRLTAPAFLPFLIVVVFHLLTKVAGWGELDHASKYLLMPALAIPVVALDRRGPLLPRVLLLLSVLFSWLGDITLVNFVVGLAFFLLAHLAYTATFAVRFSRRVSPWSLLYALWFVALLATLWTRLGAMLLPVAIYGAALAVMAAVATKGNALTSVGSALFVLSDTMLAFRLFTPLMQGVAADISIMLAYLAAQALIVLGLLRRQPR